MGKQISLLMLLAVVAIATHAQEDWRLGPKATVAVSSMLGNADADFKVGYKAGLVGEVNIREGYQFQPQLVYSSLGARFDIEGQTGHLEYLRLVAMNRFTPFNNPSIYTSIGPYIGYLLNKRLSGENGYSFQKTNKIDAGLAVAGGYELNLGKEHHLLAQIEYSLGVRPVFDRNEDDTNEYNHAAGLSLIYFFAL